MIFNFVLVAKRNEWRKILCRKSLIIHGNYKKKKQNIKQSRILQQKFFLYNNDFHKDKCVGGLHLKINYQNLVEVHFVGIFIEQKIFKSLLLNFDRFLPYLFHSLKSSLLQPKLNRYDPDVICM